MELATKLILLYQILKRLIQFLSVQLVYLQEEALHTFIIQFL